MQNTTWNVKVFHMTDECVGMTIILDGMYPTLHPTCIQPWLDTDLMYPTGWIHRWIIRTSDLTHHNIVFLVQNWLRY